MRRLDIILRTCSNSILEEKFKQQKHERISGQDRKCLLYNCLISLIQTINNSNFNIHLTILDDHSSEDYLNKINILLEKCKKPYSIHHLKKTGFNNSAYEQFLIAAKCEDLVYTVEDDYLHELNAINNLLNAYFYLETRFKDKIVLSPFDCPYRYDEGKEELTTLFYDGSRYWRTTSQTTHTIFTKASFFKYNFEVLKNLALNYPKVDESDTINKLYKKNLSEEDKKYKLFSPIPSIAYHLAYRDPAEIRTEHLSWRHIWNNNYKIDLIDGWFNYEGFYNQIAPKLNNDSIICEIGAWLGRSTIGMALTNKKLNKKCKIYAIDTWKGSNEQNHKDFIKGLKKKNTSLYERFLHNIQIYGVDDVIEPIQKTSIKAAKQFEDNSIDIIIIDGSHEYNDVLNDIKTWIPKVKKGGMIIGDDYHPTWQPVMNAVNDYFGKDNFGFIENIWYKII